MTAVDILRQSYLTHEELYVFLGVNERTLADMRRAGSIPYVAVTAKQFLYRLADIEEFLVSRVIFKSPDLSNNLNDNESKKN